jgi:energy-coupling factor transporter ATP-binding protein EcfA2
VAIVMRPIPIKSLIEPPGADSLLGRLEAVAAGAGIGRIWLYAGIVIALEAVIFCAMISTEAVISRMGERVVRSIRGSIVATLLRGPYRALGEGGPGAVLAAASTDVEAVQRLMREAIVATGMSALQMTLMLVVVFFVEAWLFWFLLVEILLLTAGIALYALWRKSRFLAKLEHEQRYLGLLATIFQRNLDLRFSGLRTLFLVRATAVARRLYGVNRLLWMRHSHYHATMQFVIGASAALCLVILMLLAGEGAPPVGKFLVFAYYTMLIFPCLSQIGEAWPMINDARAALRRITANTGAGETAGAGAPAIAARTAPRPEWGRIEFDEVSVRNPRGDTILDRVSFAIEPGRKIGLFGDSGSGKTTIISVLLGLQTPSGGRATIGGFDVTRLTLADRKRLFFFMRSSPAFLPGSVRRGRPAADPGAVAAGEPTGAGSAGPRDAGQREGRALLGRRAAAHRDRQGLPGAPALRDPGRIAQFARRAGGDGDHRGAAGDACREDHDRRLASPPGGHALPRPDRVRPRRPDQRHSRRCPGLTAGARPPYNARPFRAAAQVVALHREPLP